MSGSGKRFLLLSGMPVGHSAGLASDLIKALEARGHKVDFLTRDIDAELRSRPIGFRRMAKTLVRSARRNLRFIDKAAADVNRWLGRGVENNIDFKYPITHPDDSQTPLPIETITDRIHGNYDAVITLYWQSMISAKTLQLLYERLQVPILIYAVDMEPFTGGCHYFSNCRNYKSQCGRCPGLRSDDPADQSHQNYLIKKDIYSKVPCRLLCNTWMGNIAADSDLFEPDQIVKFYICLDDNVFRPMDVAETRRFFDIPDSKKHILLFRYSDFDPRKGFPILTDALARLYESMTGRERSETLLLIAGSPLENAGSMLPFDYKHLGLLDQQRLIKAYNASTLFLSPSVDDAGPSMVNQAILCGTPCVTFAIGTAIDVIQTGVSGYKARNFDAGDYARGILEILRLSEGEYRALRAASREMGLKCNSLDAAASVIESALK